MVDRRNLNFHLKEFSILSLTKNFLYLDGKILLKLKAYYYYNNKVGLVDMSTMAGK